MREGSRVVSLQAYESTRTVQLPYYAYMYSPLPHGSERDVASVTCVRCTGVRKIDHDNSHIPKRQVDDANVP